MWLLGGLVLFGSFLEVVGVSLVLPILAVVSDPAWIARLSSVPAVGGWLAEQSQARLLGIGLAAMLGIGGLKFAALGLLSYVQSRFAGSVERTTSSKLFRGFLRRPWEYHLRRNSAELIQLCRVEVINVAYVVTGFLNILTDGAMILCVLVFLVLAEPLAAAVGIVLLSATGGLFYFLTYERLERWGRERQAADIDRIRHLQQGLSSVREITVLQCQDQFAAQYESRTRAYVRVLSLQQFLQHTPRLGLELVAVIAVAGISVVLVSSGREVNELVPALGLFVAASVRVIPSANRLLGAIQLIRWGAPSVASVVRELHELPDSTAAKPVQAVVLPRSGAIEVESVSYRYPGSSSDALHGLTASIALGSTVGVIGASGSGKTTLMDVLLGLIAPSAGRVHVGGLSIYEHLDEWHRCVAYVPQSIQLIDDTLRRNVAFGVEDSKINEQKVWQAIRGASLESFVKSLPEGLDARVGEEGSWLSGGQRQRIGIARALYRDPQVLVLDEATSALDTDTEAEFMQVVSALRGKKTVVIVAHRLSTLAMCDRVLRLAAGRIVADGSFASVVGDQGSVS